ncbi:MAG: CRISPR-associated helicase Cas3' [Thermoplasmata archaeon]
MTCLSELFKNVTGFSPYEFQRAAMDILYSNRPLIMIAPTGSGKTETVVVPYLAMTDVPHMFYSLPTRSLANNIYSRICKVTNGKKACLCHGGVEYSSRPEFRESIIIATIDQTVGCYLSNPLSLPAKWGNIYAGAVASSMLVFDEIHVLHPQKGLQTSMWLSKEAAKLELPIAMISATLPDLIANKIATRIDSRAEPYIVHDDSEIPSRKNRSVNIVYNDSEITVQSILNTIHSSDGKKAIVVVNTVDKAQKIYKELKSSKHPFDNIILAHSRYTEADRKTIEERIVRFFGKESGNLQSILVTTQVIEVGMDISAPTIISEAAPIDALIQRAGRCSRWGGNGNFIVHNIEDNFAPYSKDLVMKSLEVIKNHSDQILDWSIERKWVNEILTDPFSNYMNEGIMYNTLGVLCRAVYEGRKSDVENAVREFTSCNLTILNNPIMISPEEAYNYESVRVDVNLLSSKWKKLGLELFSIVEDNFIDADSGGYVIKKLKSDDRIIPGGFYITQPDKVQYDPEFGLTFDEEIIKKPEELNKRIKTNEIEMRKEYKKELWAIHAKKTLEKFKKLWEKYERIIKAICCNLDANYDRIRALSEICAALHDLGKLNEEWQSRAGAKGNCWLAHTGNDQRLPPHATVTAAALNPLIHNVVDKNIGLYKAFILACAHHHSPRAREYPHFKLVYNWYDVVRKIINIEHQYVCHNLNCGSIPWKMLDIAENGIDYRFYAILSRLIRLADWEATRETCENDDTICEQVRSSGI